MLLSLELTDEKIEQFAKNSSQIVADNFLGDMRLKNSGCSDDNSVAIFEKWIDSED